ncbi:MAG: hypothetical protein K0U33_06230 [Bacteroidetes bacterium]|jgi:hypothetical protein|nr:hypothetical protein [Bacteroidota bacterium]MDA9938022.1 hypothetical protein [Salibacteraceae bacterium]
MNRQLAQILSYAFHPGVMPTLGLFLLLQGDTYLKYSIGATTKNFLYLIIFLNTYLFPALIVLIMRYRNAISSLQLIDRKERVIPMAVASFFYLLTYLLIKKLTLPGVLSDMFFGLALSVFAVFFITLRYKISAHMTGIGGLIGAFVGFQVLFGAQLAPWVVLLVLVWGVIGTARLKLEAHSNGQIVAGSMLGFTCIFFSILAGLG